MTHSVYKLRGSMPTDPDVEIELADRIEDGELELGFTVNANWAFDLRISADDLERLACGLRALLDWPDED